MYIGSLDQVQSLAQLIEFHKIFPVTNTFLKIYLTHNSE